MSNPGARSARLLHADEEQLDRAAILLRTGTAFVVVVCPPELRSAVLRRLRSQAPGLSLPDPVAIGDAWKMLDALVGQVERRDSVLSMALNGHEASAFDGLNLHREKVLKGGPVILWLPDVDALMKMRERAPDAFSFRSTMVVVRGEWAPLLPPKDGEPDGAGRARRRLKRSRTPIEKVSSAVPLADALRICGKTAEAEEVARRALSAAADATDHRDADDEARETKIRLYLILAAVVQSRGTRIEAFQLIRRGLDEASHPLFARGPARRAALLAAHPGPFEGLAKREVEEAVALVRKHGLAPEECAQALRGASSVSRALGDLRQAVAFAEESRGLCAHIRPFDVGLGLAEASRIAGAAGRFAVAESTALEAAKTMAPDGGAALLYLPLIRWSIDQGETARADRLIDEYEGQRDDERCVALLRAGLSFLRGDTKALVATGIIALSAADAGRDIHALSAIAAMTEMTAAAHEAIALPLDAISLVDLAVQTVCTMLLSLSGPHGPPWYPIQLLSLQTRLLALSPDRHPRALALARLALALAHRTYPDLTPETGRVLADVFLAAGKPDEALAAIAEVELYAGNGFLGERARLCADRVLAHVLRGDSPEAITPHVTALREACAATASPRLTAEVLRDLAKRLPPASTTPDPRALAEEAHGLFLAMPMPAEDARCLEIMGDVDLARGRPAEARRRYLSARARLDHYELGLRVPMLARKLEAIP